MLCHSLIIYLLASRYTAILSLLASRYSFCCSADAPFRSSESSQKGLQGRMTQYNNYFLPNVARLRARLRIRKQLVALPFQRIAGDDDMPYNVDRGNQTEVLAREKHFHYFLDQMDLRWRKGTNKELFVPTQGVMQLVEAMRKVQGLSKCRVRGSRSFGLERASPEGGSSAF